jgi:hypothetical protein
MGSPKMYKTLVLSMLAAGLLAGCGGGSTTSSKAAGKTVTMSVAGTASATTSSPSGGSTAGRTTTGPSATTHSTPGRSTPAPQSRASAAGSAHFKQAMSSFAACLSHNGVKLPAGGSGAAPALSLKGVDTKSPAYRKALAACIPVINAALKAATKARPGSASPSDGGGSASGGSPRAGSSAGSGSARAPAVKIPASVTAGFERFTACMRSNGVAGFPEPTGASFNMSGTHLDTHSSQYKAAEKRCDPILMAVDSGG